jgi:hypothetical protein
MLLMKERVDVIDQSKSSLSSRDSRFSGDWPSIEFLRDISELIVISVESVECPQPVQSARVTD